MSTAGPRARRFFFGRAETELNTQLGYGIVGSMETTVALDERVHRSALRRLAIIEGQVRGLRRMIENGTGCVEVLTQVSAIHEALRGVGKVIVRHHIETCVTEGLQSETRRQHQDELMDLIYKLSK